MNVQYEAMLGGVSFWNTQFKPRGLSQTKRWRRGDRTTCSRIKVSTKPRVKRSYPCSTRSRRYRTGYMNPINASANPGIAVEWHQGFCSISLRICCEKQVDQPSLGSCRVTASIASRLMRWGCQPMLSLSFKLVKVYSSFRNNNKLFNGEKRKERKNCQKQQ